MLSEKAKLVDQVVLKTQERHDVLDRVEELRQRKLKLLLERSRVENTMMKRIKVKEDLFRRLQDLDE